MRRFLKTVAFLLVVFFLASYLIENWTKIGKFEYEINWPCLSLAFLALLVSLFFLVLALRQIVKVLGYELSIKKMCAILFYSQIAKYLPGGIWGYVGRVYLYKKEGMSAGDASTCVFLETLLVLLSGIFVFFVSLLFWDKNIPIASMGWVTQKNINGIGLLVLVILFSLMHPKVLNLLWGLLPDRLVKNRLRFNYNYFLLLRPALFMVLFWLGIGTGFWLLIKTTFYIDVFLLPMAVGAYTLAWIIGFLAFFTPGGLGAREAALILTLNLWLPTHISAVMAVASRIWWIMGELLWAFFSFAWNRLEAAKNEIVRGDSIH
jgi:uncharacterized membrane protein YbhN (UPF0104 family)